MVLRHTTDHLGDEHGLTDASATKQANLAALKIRGEQVNNLDTGLEHLGVRFKRVEGRSWTVDVPTLKIIGVTSGSIERITPGVPDVTEHLCTNRHADATTGVANRGAALEPVGGLETYRTHSAVAQMLRHLGEHRGVLAFDGDRHLEGKVDLRQSSSGELAVDNGPGDGDDPAILQCIFGHSHNVRSFCFAGSLPLASAQNGFRLRWTRRCAGGRHWHLCSCRR